MTTQLSQNEFVFLNKTLALLDELTSYRQTKYDYAKSSDGTIALEIMSADNPYSSSENGSVYIRANYGCGAREEFETFEECYNFLIHQYEIDKEEIVEDAWPH